MRMWIFLLGAAGNNLMDDSKRFTLLIMFICSLVIGCADLNSTGSAKMTSGSRSVTVPLDYLPALKGDYFPLESKWCGRKFHIYIRFPAGYDPQQSRRYPVIYLLDGDSLFSLLAPTHLFLTYDEHIPEAIIVGISYGGFESAINKRNIDFTAPAEDSPPGEHGAPEFLYFLKDELLPAVENQYKADAGKRILLGQSRGGYFVLWSALEMPDLFWGRIASNPTFTPGRARFFADAKPHARTDLKLFLASGTRDSDLRKENAKAWALTWQHRNDAPWQLNFSVLNGGTHAASIGEAYRQAMLWLFN